jgi:glutamate synthase domain-containing protein 1/glutamate synthase domain-containing protein 3
MGSFVMNRINISADTARAIINSRISLVRGRPLEKKRALEGGCGVIGIIGSEKIAGKNIIRPCEQMRNRGNGKGGGVAAVGLFDEYKNHHALHIAFLDEDSRGSVEKEFVNSAFDVSHAEQQVCLDDYRDAGLEIKPPLVWRYFVKVKPEKLDSFAEQNRMTGYLAAESEFIFQNSFRLNAKYYEGKINPRAFVLSHSRNLMILKGVGYAEEIARYYCLEDTRAHLWIGHQRYPTRGRVWHPGGAHPFVGLNEALVHNGDFANYHAVCEYLRQWGVVPQFVTDTEVAVLLFDLYSRVLGYPLEFVIEALAPTPQGDFERLSKRRQRIFRAIQTAHLHGSPDGPWFFIVARTEPETGAPQLIGITDVSMLRPQVFCLYEGKNKSFGAIASEKQALDAFFKNISEGDDFIPHRADRYWAARGGSCTDGGAFVYTLNTRNTTNTLDVRDKFGNQVKGHLSPIPQKEKISQSIGRNSSLNENGAICTPLSPAETHSTEMFKTLKIFLQEKQYADFASGIEHLSKNKDIRDVLSVLARLQNFHWDPKKGQKTFQLSAISHSIETLLDSISGPPAAENLGMLRLTASSAWEKTLAECRKPSDTLVIDADKFPTEGSESVSRIMAIAYEKGWRNFIVYRCRGDRFIGCGLGSETVDVRIDVFGSSGDYLGSGLDGAQIFVHGDAQDQVGQILKSGKIVIYGSVGQTFLYGAKGGEAYVLGSAAGRPLINAVGSIRAIINGTCLDYCAESFMAGAQTGGGFVIINGLDFDERGEVLGLELKYPGNNLFSLASGGACYLNDPYQTVTENQLNGAEFIAFKREDWNTILPYLQENERLFGISIRHDVLMVDGVLKWPEEVFRKIIASRETKDLDWTSLD